MKNCIVFIFAFFSLNLFSQTDFSTDWEDFFSYNNVKEIIIEDDLAFALTDNAFFTYNTASKEVVKFSSVQGLSGEATSTFFYSKQYKRLVIGYESGLLEIIDEDGTIKVAADIKNFNQAGSKSINAIAGNGKTLYLATPFAIVEYDVENLEFGDTFFIGNGSSEVAVNDIALNNNKIYAATVNGIFEADATNNTLIDFNNWTQNFSNLSFSKIQIFNNKAYASNGRNLFEVNGSNRTLVKSFNASIKDIKASGSTIFVTADKGFLLNTSFVETYSTPTLPSFNYSLSSFLVKNNIAYLATEEFGILKGTLNNVNYEEIHPEGPLSNDIFAIDVHKKNLWVVYGGFDNTFAPLGFRKGFSHFTGETWLNYPNTLQNPLPDLVHVTIDKSKENSVFISAMGSTTDINSRLTGGLVHVENDVIANFYNQNNSALQDILVNNPSIATIRTNGSAFDRDGNLWITNIGVSSKLKKLSPDGNWTSYNINSQIFNTAAIGLNDLVVDNTNTVWVATRRNGVIAFNENNNQITSLTENAANGNLPNLNVKSLASDSSNRIWIGTTTGLVVLNNAANVFNTNIKEARPVIFEEEGIAKRLLDDQPVNVITVDGAQNKWFGTDSGVIQTNATGLVTLTTLNTENSPLPSNKITDIKIDETTGKVFIATDKGMLSYNSRVAPFGEELTEVYAYPNPVLAKHQTVTIDGRNGNHLPRGTNVKILDISGRLVFESNVIEGQETQGGKVVWNKRNLAGKKVASGVYIVVLSNEDNSENTTTKIAIVN